MPAASTADRSAPIRPVNWYGNWYSPEPDPSPAPEPKRKDPAPRPDEPRPERDEPDQPQANATGLILGRFCPPHRGHQHLVDFARASVQQLTVILCSTAEDPIPAELRFGWMRELFPDVRLLHESLPSGQEKRSWPEWATAVRSHRLSGPDLLFASDRRASHLAELLGAELVLVDPERRAVPISASQIREAPLRHWAFLPDCVKPWFVRRVGIVGAERTGKTTLARRLAAELQTVCVEERALAVAVERDGRLRPSDVERIARGQLAAEQALARQANRLLISDTDLNTVALWGERLFGSCPESILQAARRQRLDLVLVQTFPEAEAAGSRRAAFQARLLEVLAARGQRALPLHGSIEERFNQARRAVAALLE